MNLKNKKIIILGVSGTLGITLLKDILNEGAIVLGIDKSNCNFNEKNFKFLKLKITSSIKKGELKILQDLEKADVLINCIGDLGTVDYSKKIKIKDIQKELTDTFYAPIKLMQIFLAHSNKKQKILVNISSFSSKNGTAFHLVYSISKVATDNFIKCLSKEENSSRNRFIIIYPRTMRSRLANESLKKVKPFFKKEKIKLKLKRQEELLHPELASKEIISAIKNSKSKLEEINL